MNIWWPLSFPSLLLSKLPKSFLEITHFLRRSPSCTWCYVMKPHHARPQQLLYLDWFHPERARIELLILLLLLHMLKCNSITMRFSPSSHTSVYPEFRIICGFCKKLLLDKCIHKRRWLIWQTQELKQNSDDRSWFKTAHDIELVFK